MKTFFIKSSLAHGLAYRLETLDPQVVVDTVGIDVIEAIRANQRIADNINQSNREFYEAVTLTEQKKRTIMEGLQVEYKKDSDGKTDEEKAKLARDLTAQFSKEAAEVQKGSTANPDTVIRVELGDDDYEKILIPIFKKTAQLWDVNGDGSGQKTFLAVADALQTLS